MKKIIWFLFLTVINLAISCVSNNYYIVTKCIAPDSLNKRTITKERLHKDEMPKSVIDSIFREHVQGRNGEKLLEISRQYLMWVDSLIDSTRKSYNKK